MEGIDFTKFKRSLRFYTTGSEQKFGITDGENYYMLKMPKNVRDIHYTELSYANNVISEYLGSKILWSIGFPVQDVRLGTWGDKVCVACRDFVPEGFRLVEFAAFKRGYVNDSSSNGENTELSEVFDTIENHEQIQEKEKVKEFFWNLFIGDSLIGNFDRHNGNWGFLVNEGTGIITLAPVYDCGSSLFARAGEEMMKQILADPKMLQDRIYSIPASAIKYEGRKINYFSFISSLENEECNQALRRVYPNIDMKKIEAIVDGTPYISALQKEFYKKILNERYDKILTFSYNRMMKRERKMETEKNKIL